MNCAECKKPLVRKRFNGRLEDLSVFMRRKYCGRACMALGQMKKSPTRSAIQKRLKAFRKEQCEACGSIRHLCVHHIDKDWNNNSQENLKTLCNSCHTKLHHSQGDISPKQERSPCSICAKPSYRLGLCCTHLTRYKRHGDALVVNGQKVSYGEPPVPRTTQEKEQRVERIKRLGNGVVPLQARIAFERLMFGEDF